MRLLDCQCCLLTLSATNTTTLWWHRCQQTAPQAALLSDVDAAGNRTVYVWRYHAFDDVWAEIRRVVLPSGQPIPSTISARTNVDAVLGYRGSGRIDWFHSNTTGNPMWEQLRAGRADDRYIQTVVAVPSTQATAAIVSAQAEDGKTLRVIWIEPRFLEQDPFRERERRFEEQSSRMVRFSRATVGMFFNKRRLP